METAKNIYTQLFALQNEIGAIAKTETNPFFKSKYFDINKLLEELKPMLEKHGLVVIQPLTNLNGKPAIETVVASTLCDGEIRSITPLPENPDPQKMGAITTYYRRYALQSLFLLQAEDTDANDVMQAIAPLNRPQPQHTTFPYPNSVNVSKSETCNKCGSPTKLSKQGKKYCAATCWLKKGTALQQSFTPPATVNYDEPPMDDAPPFV